MSLCQCGCGTKTRLAPQTDTRKGWVKGQPLRYVSGHVHRNNGPEYRADSTTGCWEWVRMRDALGYGRAPGGKFAHRLVYERLAGPIPEGLELDHLCRNRICCNPSHLEPVTHQENLRRGLRTKLDVERVRQIKCLIGSMSMSAIARRFGVHHSTIANIAHGIAWADVDAESRHPTCNSSTSSRGSRGVSG